MRHYIRQKIKEQRARTKMSFILILCSLILSVSCEHPDLTVSQPNENLRTAGDFIRNNYQFRLLYEALDYTGLYEELNDDGPYTVFAMTDAVFNSMGIYNRADIEKLDQDSLRQALAYNILPINLPTSDFPTNGLDRRYLTLSSKELYASSRVYNGMFLWYIDGVYVDKDRMDVNLANGTLHLLTAPTKYHPDHLLTDWLEKQQEYSVFVSALKKFGLWDELVGEGPFTVFAPTNTALRDVGVTDEWLEQVNTEEYNAPRLIGAYIVYDKHFFLSDYFVLGATIVSNRIILPIKGDSYSIAWSTQSNYTGVTSYGLYLMPPNATNVNTQSVARTGSSSDMMLMNHRFENGVVHQLQGGLVRPELATRN